MAARIVRTFDGLRVSTVDWPIIVMEFPAKLVPDASLHDALAYFEGLLKEAKESRERTYTITDLSEMHQLAPAAQRKYVGDWMKRTVLLQKAVSLGGANVTPSTILRGLITAIYWLVPPPMPAVFVASRREAYAVAIKAFDDARVPIAPELRAAPRG